MEIKTEITRKDIRFINDFEFRKLIQLRLSELDRVFLVNGNYSAVFLAISILEGIFRHISKYYKSEIKASARYPLDNGKKIPFDKLAIDHLYDLLQERQIVPKVDNLKYVYELFRDYRNFIHPQAQQKKAWSVGLGQAQMALGLLNSTIDYLAPRIFIGKEMFRTIEGSPDFVENILQLKLTGLRLNSFLVLDRPITNDLELTFQVDFQEPRGILNFVFNFVDDGNFKMIRLDTRDDPQAVNSILNCTQKYFWRQIYFADDPHPPTKSWIEVKILIDISQNLFDFIVDGKRYNFKDGKGKKINLFDELKSNLRVGFFNEVRPIKLTNIKIK